MRSRACMILAAGFGTRMGALTADRPKPLIEVAGRKLLDHALEVATAAQAKPIAVNGHYRAGQMQAYLSAHHPGVHFLHEVDEILDSGGGVKNALPLLGADPIFTLNADAVWSKAAPLSDLEAAWDGRRMGALLLLVPRARAVGREGGGDFAMDAEGRLTWDKGADGLVYTGAQILDPGPLSNHPDAVFSLRDIWQGMMDEGRLFGVIHQGHWADMGHPAGIVAAEEMVRRDTPV
ncbi:nucleotidyltransferase family protein [Roseibacterium beibuensis]|nr:nucleotidyltransferase family protein [Roseibacterium beibuensis]MCS6626590.1 nucleotidyltransferase family protein [Roseibacterium beibuensis]